MSKMSQFKELINEMRELEELLDNPDYADSDPMDYHETWERYEILYALYEDFTF